MALGYFARAASRATSAAPDAAPAIKPAAAIPSPLVEEDQRLNLSNDVEHVTTPDAPAPESPIIAREPPKNTDQPETDAVPAPTPPESEQSPFGPADDPHMQPLPNVALEFEPPEASAPKIRKTAKGAPEAKTIPIKFESDLPNPPEKISEHDVADSKPETPKRHEPKPAQPETNVMKAIAAVERWVAMDTDVEAPSVENVVVIPETPLARSSDVEPVLPQTTEAYSAPEPAEPVIQIGSIEVELVPPPAPKQAPQRPRSNPVKALTKPTMPFGWRQR